MAFPLVAASWRLPLAVAAAASDLVDGEISRRLHATSRFGRLLDPIADKAFVLAVVGTLWFDGTLRLWQIALVGLRDWTVLGAALWHLAARDHAAVLRMAPSVLGKITTGAQFLFLLSLLYFERVVSAPFWLAVVLSGLSAVDYLRHGTQRGEAPQFGEQESA